MKVSLRNEPKKLQEISDLLKLLCNPSRLGILELLQEQGALPVNQIASEMDFTQSATSQYLRTLERGGILSSSRVGKQVFYQVEHPIAIQLLRCILG